MSWLVSCHSYSEHRASVKQRQWTATRLSPLSSFFCFLYLGFNCPFPGCSWVFLSFSALGDSSSMPASSLHLDLFTEYALQSIAIITSLSGYLWFFFGSSRQTFIRDNFRPIYFPNSSQTSVYKFLKFVRDQIWIYIFGAHEPEKISRPPPPSIP